MLKQVEQRWSHTSDFKFLYFVFISMLKFIKTASVSYELTPLSQDGLGPWWKNLIAVFKAAEVLVRFGSGDSPGQVPSRWLSNILQQGPVFLLSLLPEKTPSTSN